MNIFYGGSRAFLAGEYTQARHHHRPSASTWARLRDATTAEIDHTVECESAVELALASVEAEAMARLRFERLKYLALVIGAVLLGIGLASFGVWIIT